LAKAGKRISAFEIIEIDKNGSCVVLEDKEIGLQVKISTGKKQLIEAKIVSPYKIKLTYEDGLTELKLILK
jgi:hypothetical protein